MQLAPFAALVMSAVMMSIAIPAAEAKDGQTYPAVPLKQSGSGFEEAAGLDTAEHSLAEAAGRQDAEAIRKLAGASFFYDRDFGGVFDPAKSALENFNRALGIDAGPDDDAPAEAVYGRIARLAAPERFIRVKGAFCGPADPVLSDEALKAAAAAVDGEIYDFVAVEAKAVPLRAEASQTAASIGTVSREAVYVLDRLDSDGAEAESPWVKVRIASGKEGYVPRAATRALVEEKLCWKKEKDAWRIVGLIGAGD